MFSIQYGVSRHYSSEVPVTYGSHGHKHNAVLGESKSTLTRIKVIGVSIQSG